MNGIKKSFPIVYKFVTLTSKRFIDLLVGFVVVLGADENFVIVIFRTKINR